MQKTAYDMFEVDFVIKRQFVSDCGGRRAFRAVAAGERSTNHPNPQSIRRTQQTPRRMLG